MRRLLAVVLTPLALTVLLSEPGRAQPEQAAAEAVETHAAGEHGESHVPDGHPLKNFSYLHYDKDEHGGTLEPGEHKMPPPFLAVLVNFAAFVWLIGRFGGPSVRKAVRERHESIARQLAEGARLREEARARLAEYDRKLAALQGEIDALVSGIRGEAEAESKRIIGEAQARAVRLQQDAELQITAEMQRVRATLEREAVEAAVGIAGQLLLEKTTDADQRALADRFLKGLQETAGKRRTTV